MLKSYSPSTDRQSLDQPPKIARVVSPRSRRIDNWAVSSATPESCELPPPKTARTSSQSTDTTSITTAIARKTKVRTTQAVVAKSSKSHKTFIVYSIARADDDVKALNRTQPIKHLCRRRLSFRLPLPSFRRPLPLFRYLVS